MRVQIKEVTTDDNSIRTRQTRKRDRDKREDCTGYQQGKQTGTQRKDKRTHRSRNRQRTCTNNGKVRTIRKQTEGGGQTAHTIKLGGNDK